MKGGGGDLLQTINVLEGTWGPDLGVRYSGGMGLFNWYFWIKVQEVLMIKTKLNFKESF